MIGSVLGESYRITHIVGRGAMGTVFGAEHLRLPRRVAIKVLNAITGPDEAALERFEREALITSALRHPHIVEVVDFNRTDDGEPYVVMELLDGVDLEHLIQEQGQIPLEQVASVLRQVASALDASHGAGVIHRDLKPSNVFLCRRGRRDDYVKLLDFGISKVLGAQSKITATHMSLGTPAYMSPEQARGESANVDARSDIFSVGAIVYEMLTGRPAFGGQSIIEVVHKVLYEDPPPLGALRRDLPPSLEPVVARAVRKHATDRYGRASEFAEAFAEAALLQAMRMVPTEDVSCEWVSQADEDDEEDEDSATETIDPVAAAPRPASEALAMAIPPPVQRLDLGAGGRELGPDAASVQAWAAPRVPLSGVDRGELARGLEQSAAGRSSTAHAVRPPRDRRWIALLVSMAALFSAGLIAAILVLSGDGPSQRPALRLTPLDTLAPDAAAVGPAADAASLPDTNSAALARRLWIDSRPRGAAVSIDDEQLGKTPIEAHSVAITSQTIVVHLEGHRPWRRTIAAGTADVRLTARLKRRGRARAGRPTRQSPPAAVELVTLRLITKGPSGLTWAEITIDGKSAGRSPLQLRLPPGRHRIRAQRDGYRLSEQVVDLDSGQNRHVVIPLQPR